MNIALNQSNLSPQTLDAAKQSKLADAAHQFEAIMLQELLKPLRSGEDDLSGEKSEDGSFDTMSGFGTESVAKAISQSGGLGIAKQVMRQLGATECSASKEIPDGTKV